MRQIYVSHDLIYGKKKLQIGEPNNVVLRTFFKKRWKKILFTLALNNVCNNENTVLQASPTLQTILTLGTYCTTT